MRLKALSSLLCGVLLIALCGIAEWRSVRLARADWTATPGTAEALEKALLVVPENPTLLARAAVARNDSGDASPEVDEELQRALGENPFDSAVLMTLGLREEFRGNAARAEGYLVRAAEVDHQFKPAWTLANFYYRTNQPDKSWPMIERILKLQPLGFDPTPVFQLCWNEGGGGKILTILPRHGDRAIQYLAFLMATKRTDAALGAWPAALLAADPAAVSDSQVLSGFVEFLVNADRVTDAVQAWNQLVDRGILRAGQLNPGKGVSITNPSDPEFRIAGAVTGFGWRTADVPGIISTDSPGSVRYEFSGDQPQSAVFLSIFAPVLSGRRYRMVWKSDGSALSSPKDPGFSFQITQQPGNGTTQCQPLLTIGGCDFVTANEGDPGHMGRARIDLQYTRAQGTTRVTGALALSSVRLELAP